MKKTADRVSSLFPALTDPLLTTAIAVLISVREGIRRTLRIQPGTAFRKRLIRDPSGGRPKEMLFIDEQAENEYREELLSQLHDVDHERYCVLGEETLWNLKGLDLSRQRVLKSGEVVNEPETRLVAILDMIDGSDLLERDFGNWCSAVVLFDPNPPKPKVLFTIVHDSRDRLYGAHHQEGTFLITYETHQDQGKNIYTLFNREDLAGARSVSVGEMAVCFYAQKRKPFSKIPASFHDWLKNVPRAERLRLYTLAGNPMMARLANDEKVHAVFEHVGQFPHDAVPGAYIALKSGSTLLDLRDGTKITEAMLATHLLKPSGASLRYVLGSSKRIASQLVGALQESP